MTGTSYSRTPGNGILDRTWEAVRARHPGQTIHPQDRLGWDDATQEERDAFTALMQQPLTAAPPFLVFNLSEKAGKAHAASVDKSQGMPANGHLEDGLSEQDAAKRLGISVEELKKQLPTFSGTVILRIIPAGVTLYRTVGLVAQQSNYGGTTNRPLGEFWATRCPSTYASIVEWRRAVAVKEEWNGDYGYIPITLDKEVIVLEGVVGMQFNDIESGQVLPGGGWQVYIPRMHEQLPEIARRLETIPLSESILPTRFAGPHFDE